MDKVIKYAEDAAAGRLPRPIGRSEIQAAERFLRDLERQESAEFPFVYSEAKAQELIGFSEMLTLDEGEEPQPFIPADFQAFIFGNWNGWVIKDTNNRRFRTSYIQIGRQNGKSVMNAVPALFYGNFDGYKYPQIYCAATKERQAKVVLKECYKFLQADKELCGDKLHKGLFTIQDYKSEIQCNLTRGTIVALGRDTDTIDGFRPYFASIDEYHKHKTNQMYKLLADGDKKMKSCLISIITTAGFNLNGPCKREYDYGRNILEGFPDDNHFVFIAEPDQEDRKGENVWNENVWIKAHPLWTPETLISLRADARQAREKGGEDFLNFLTKDLNVWVQAGKDQYLDNDKWEACASDTTLDDMHGRECYLGLDLSSGGDLTTGALEFPLDDSHIYIDSHSFMPSARLLEHEQTDKAPYRIWVKEGQITLTDTLGGYKTDYRYIVGYYRALFERYDLKLKGIAYDPHNADAFLQDLEEFGCDMLMITQSARFLNDGTQDFKNCVDAGQVVRDRRNTLLEWSFRNAVVTHNSFGEIKIDKDYRQKRIDPCDAAINAHILGMKNRKTYDPNEAMEDYLNMMNWRS